MQSGKYRSPGNCQTQTCPSDSQTEKRDWPIQRTCLHCSRVQWQHALHHGIRRFALRLVIMLCHFTWPTTWWLSWWIIAQVTTYHGSTLEFTELLRATHSFTNVVEAVCMP
ncbi:unnamed protein product, partial [Staurois parvus]